ncbi:hypothetical protein [Pedobacter roseus]|uniref:Uncharacterized protein n=1 Tax=Pedobacter roseus TaxID=336820 RepID=A0A7G9QHX5_9SPHI|nr:hypothetical protein [Pedobacter roseus]QNN42950.1 hypothetical protein H9L23_02255 [Pedobacter roseus]
MIINNIDDLLKYLEQYTLLPVSKSTLTSEQKVIDEAERKNLVYQSSNHTYKLDSLGYDVLKSRLSWEQFSQLQNAKHQYGIGTALANAGMSEGLSNSMKYAEEVKARSSYIEALERVASKPQVLPLAPELSNWQKFVNLQDSPKLNQRIAFWAGVGGIVSTIIAIGLLFTL